MTWMPRTAQHRARLRSNRGVEGVSFGFGDCTVVLTKFGRRNQRRRDRAGRGHGTGQDSAGQPYRDQTEGRTETRSSSKDYADTVDDAVNKPARKSVEGKEFGSPHWTQFEPKQHKTGSARTDLSHCRTMRLPLNQ